MFRGSKSHRLLSLLAALVGAVLLLLPSATTAVAARSIDSTTAGTDVPEVRFLRYRLDNGLEVILHQDNRVPLVAVDVWYHVGSGNEVLGKSGFAHLFEHMMFQGAKHIGEDVHFELLKQVGATSVNGSTNSDRTNYFEIVPRNQLETALWLESDRMGYLLDLLNEKSLENQRDVVRNERRQNYDNVAYGKDRFAIAAGLYPEGHPYRYLTIGRHEDLEAASLADVRGFFMKWYVPANATLVLAGDIQIEEAKQLVDKWFGSFPLTERPELAKPKLPALEKTLRREIDDPWARLVRVHYAWHSPANLAMGDAELNILARILGARGWGRLHKSLVVEKQLAQRVSVYQNGKGHNGEFHIVANVKPGADPAEVEEVIGKELKRVLAEPVREAELKRVVIGIESQLIWSLEELLSRAERLQYFNHHVGDPGYTGKYLETYRSRTPAMIEATAKKVLAKPRVEIITRPAGRKGGQG
jgi:predicted Zn-dependent peptidase